MRLTLPLLAALSIAGCATPAPALQTPPDPNCMTRENIADVLSGQGLKPLILTDEQNAAWRVFDNANSPQPDPAGFTYVIGEGDARAVLVGFNPQGCMAYYAPVPIALVATVVK